MATRPEAAATPGFFEIARDHVDEWFATIGRISIMVAETLVSISRRLPSFRLIVQQMHAIGLESLGLVVVVSLFTGAVAAVQAGYQFTAVVPLKFLSAVI